MQIDRRTLITTAAGMAAASYNRILGANDKVGLGLIGSGRQGNADWKILAANPAAAPLAVADVYEPNMQNGMTNAGGQAKGYRDFRRLLDRKDIDAVVVGTPDHWHALATIMACEAGKDVYCEKPLALTIREGRAMVAAAKKSDRIVQVGSQQRSGPHYQKAVELIRAGALGKVAHVSASLVRNAMPGVGKFADSAPPADLDWDMWLGPAPFKPYNQLRCQYNFRWFWDYSGGQMTNMGAHDLDIARWALDARGPVSVAGFGGRLCLNDGGETPDVQEVIFQFPGGTVVTWSVREMNAAPQPTLEFHGTKGTLTITRAGYQIKSEHHGSGATRKSDMEDSAMPGNNTEQHQLHVNHFIDCVKTRKRPIADVEDGHYTAAMCHLGNIATRLGRSIRYDPDTEQITGDAEANQWLARPYRAPWKLNS